MSIQSSIEEAYCAFMTETGRSPTKLYLGHKSQDELIGSLRPFLFYQAREKLERPNYKGMDVYIVNQDEYISVGI